MLVSAVTVWMLLFKPIGDERVFIIKTYSTQALCADDRDAAVRAGLAAAVELACVKSEK